MIRSSSRCGGCDTPLESEDGDVFLCPNDECSWEDPEEDETELLDYMVDVGYWGDEDVVSGIWGGR